MIHSALRLLNDPLYRSLKCPRRNLSLAHISSRLPTSENDPSYAKTNNTQQIVSQCAVKWFTHNQCYFPLDATHLFLSPGMFVGNLSNAFFMHTLGRVIRMELYRAIHKGLEDDGKSPISIWLKSYWSLPYLELSCEEHNLATPPSRQVRPSSIVHPLLVNYSRDHRLVAWQAAGIVLGGGWSTHWAMWSHYWDPPSPRPIRPSAAALSASQCLSAAQLTVTYHAPSTQKPG